MLPIRDVEYHGQYDTAAGGELRGGRLECRLAYIGDDDLHAGVQAGAGDAKSDAARGTGDEGELMPEVFHPGLQGVRRRA